MRHVTLNTVHQKNEHLWCKQGNFKAEPNNAEVNTASDVRIGTRIRQGSRRCSFIRHCCISKDI
jgi:hypothetical protein